MSGRPLGKKTRDEKREETRRLILDTAMDLFFEKGYEQTTTRDILIRSGILNGSLYNRFKSKEDILLAIVSEALSDLMATFEVAFPDNRRPILAFAAPGAVIVYISSHSTKAAELIYNACRSVAAVDMFLRSYREWYVHIFGCSSERWEDPVSVMKTSALVGAVGNICGRYSSGLQVPFEDSFEVVVRMASTVSLVPVPDISELSSEITAALDSMDIRMCGYRLSEFPDYR